MAETTKKIWTKEEIQELLKENDVAVIRGLLNLFALQTEDERISDETNHRNGVGFNGRDAEFLGSLARQAILRGKLTEKQLPYARKRILKYAGQLVKVANGEFKIDLEPIIKRVKEEGWQRAVNTRA